MIDKELKKIESYLDSVNITNDKMHNISIFNGLVKNVSLESFDDYSELIYELLKNPKVDLLLTKIYDDTISKNEDFINSFNNNQFALSLFEEFCSNKGISLYADDNYCSVYNNNSLKMYLNEASKYRILSRLEEKSLAIILSNDSTEEERKNAKEILKNSKINFSFFKAKNIYEERKLAKQDFINHNLKLVFSVAVRQSHDENDILDLIQNGNIGLTRAVEKFDYTKEYKFSTYAVWWIRQAIVTGIYDYGDGIKKPKKYGEKVRNYNNAMDSLRMKLGRTPTDAELLEELNDTWWNASNLYFVRTNILGFVRLDNLVGEEEDTSVSEFIADDNADVQNEVDSRFLKIAVDNLFANMISCGCINEREREIIKNRFGFYGDTKTLKDLADIYGITHERIRTIEESTLRRIKSFINCYGDYAIIDNDSFILKMEEVGNKSKRVRKRRTTNDFIKDVFGFYDD